MAFRSIRLPIPSASARSSFTIKEFKGVDKASGEDNFSPGRAIDMQNFIRSKVGQIQKRGGFTAANTNEAGQTHWVDFWGDCKVTFAGTDVSFKVYPGEVLACEIMGVSEIYSAVGYTNGECYYLLANTNLGPGILKCDTLNGWTTVIYKPAMEVSRKDVQISKSVVFDMEAPELLYEEIIPIPTIVSNALPDGGGRVLQTPNILTPFVKETFTVRQSDCTRTTVDQDKVCPRFQLSMKDISLIGQDGTIVDSNTWMKYAVENPNRLDWWYIEDEVRHLGIVGAEMIAKSVRVEIQRTNEYGEYYWSDTKGTTEVCFTASQDGFINTEVGAIWIPDGCAKASPVEGEASVRITYMRNMDKFTENLSRLIQNSAAVKYGVGGYKDRMFVAAGNRIYYSGMDDPLYFGELNYVEPCSADKSIVAMGGQGKYLYAVDDTGVTYAIGGTVLEDDSNTFLADAAFVILDHVQGEKPVGNILDVFGDEFCYLSEEGLVAIRHDDFYDKRYAQNRSRMLGNELKDKELCACRFGNFLVIGAGQKLYFLDEMQQTSLPDFKYSGKQYEIFPFSFSNEFVTALGGNDWHFQKVWAEKDKLYAYTGTHVLEYDPELSVDKVRGGETYPICAQWITPPFTLSSFYRKKNILQLSLRVGEVGSAVKVEYRVDGDTANTENKEWRLLRNYDGRFRVFDYGNINYGLWTYNCDIPKLQLIMNRRPSRKCYSIQFRFTNDTTDKLSLSDFGFTYETEGI